MGAAMNEPTVAKIIYEVLCEFCNECCVWHLALKHKLIEPSKVDEKCEKCPVNRIGL